MDRNVLYDYQLVSSDMARCRNIFNTLTNVNIILCQMLILNIIAYCFLKLFLYPFLSIWGIKSEAPYTGDGKWVFCRDGRVFLWTFAFPRSRVPRFFLRVPRSLVPVRLFFAFPCAPAFLFRVPMLCWCFVILKMTTEIKSRIVTLSEKQSTFPRYNMKCCGKHDTTWNFSRSIRFSPLHFMLYRAKLFSCGTVYIVTHNQKI